MTRVLTATFAALAVSLPLHGQAPTDISQLLMGVESCQAAAPGFREAHRPAIDAWRASNAAAIAQLKADPAKRTQWEANEAESQRIAAIVDYRQRLGFHRS